MNFDNFLVDDSIINSNSPILIKATGIVKNFYQAKEEVKVLQSVDFTLKKQESVAITGVSGAGKSTLLHILATLMEPTSGTIKLGSINIDYNNTKELESLRRKNLGIVFQFHYLLEDFSVLENVLLPLRIKSFYGSAIAPSYAKKKAKDLLVYLGLGHRLNFYPKDLSGGEKQRVAIARALIHEPDILFADEPTGNLDEENGEKLQQLLFELQKDLGLSLVVVTHDINFALECDSSLSMRAGQWENF
ncbi:MAG: ABC transporter ATP-binding protein [Bdellovibrionales bacterium]|nr:ABC transporter ATP-binding protein [Bdellovibrionales bacterium]